MHGQQNVKIRIRDECVEGMCFTARKILCMFLRIRYLGRGRGRNIIVHYLGTLVYIFCGSGSSVGIATELRAGRFGIESRWGRDFPPVQTGPGAHPAFCTMGTGSFPGIKCGRDVLLTSHPLLVPRVIPSYTSTHSGPNLACNGDHFTFNFFSYTFYYI